MTKRSGAAGAPKSTGARKAAPAKPVSGKPSPARPAKTTSAKPAAHILPAAKGPRTVSHRKIKEAVEKVFRERSHARARRATTSGRDRLRAERLYQLPLVARSIATGSLSAILPARISAPTAKTWSKRSRQLVTG
jgi:hypothetical protein